jgi:hypothetical protein
MVRRLLQLNSTQINWLDLPSRIMRQWFGVSANAALNTCWTQFINHANYKIIDSNVMDWTNVTKIHTPPSAKRYFPPDEHALYKDNFATGNAFSPPEAALSFWCWPKGARPLGTRMKEENAESHCWHLTAWWKCVVPVSSTLNINASDANCLLAINAQCLKKTRTLRDRRPVKALHTARLVTGT